MCASCRSEGFPLAGILFGAAFFFLFLFFFSPQGPPPPAPPLTLIKPIVLLVDVKTAEGNGNEIMKAGTTVYLSKQISGDFLKKLPDST